MATTILGTFPILNSKKSQTDEYGFDYITYEYTLKTETVDGYIPKKDDVFDGNLKFSYRGIIANPTVNESSYFVENVEVSPMDGGLSTLTVQVVGTRNPIESATPKVFIRQGGPLIFGLEGSFANGEKAFSGVGQEIEVKFLALGGSGGENLVYQTYFSVVMPTTFRGISLPFPQKKPGIYGELVSKTFVTANATTTIQIGYQIFYNGFTCKRVITERRGGLLLASLFFSEAGTALLYGPSDQNAQASTLMYNYPAYGG